MKSVLYQGAVFWMGAVVLLVLCLPTLFLFDYGTQGLILSVFGYLVRHSQDDERSRISQVFPWLIFSALSFTAIQSAVFRFSSLEVVILLFGAIAAMLALSRFRYATFPRAPAFLAVPLRMVGRHTLAIYVGHLLIIKILGLLLLPHSFRLLGWRWFP